MGERREGGIGSGDIESIRGERRRSCGRRGVKSCGARNNGRAEKEKEKNLRNLTRCQKFLRYGNKPYKNRSVPIRLMAEQDKRIGDLCKIKTK